MHDRSAHLSRAAFEQQHAKARRQLSLSRRRACVFFGLRYPTSSGRLARPLALYLHARFRCCSHSDFPFAAGARQRAQIPRERRR